MYRVFCESYNNYLNLFNDDNYRLKITKPFELIIDLKKYEEEKSIESNLYKNLCDLLTYMKKGTDKFPRLKAFLWTLESRNIIGKKYNITDKEDLEEQTKLINSFLKLAYWY